MKKIGLLFLFSFVFLFLGQILWTIALIIEKPLFGSKIVEDWSINILYSLFSIFALIGSFKIYRGKQN